MKDGNYRFSSNNYILLNSYNNIIKSIIVHFIIIIFDVFLILFEELDIFIKSFETKNTDEKSIILIIVLDSLFIFIKRKNFQAYNIYISIIVNILDLFYFRLFSLVVLNLLLSFKNNYIIFALIFIIFHSYFVINYFFYYHLYYYVPIFINFPYDEFSSLFDIILFIVKIFAAIGTSTKKNLFLLIYFCLLLFLVFILYIN